MTSVTRAVIGWATSPAIFISASLFFADSLVNSSKLLESSWLCSWKNSVGVLTVEEVLKEAVAFSKLLRL